MSNEERINDLEERLVKLEIIEKRRKIRNIIILCIYAAIVVGLITLLIVFYQKIKPYKDQLDSIRNFGSSSKTDTIIGGDSGFGDFSDFFNNIFNY